MNSGGTINTIAQFLTVLLIFVFVLAVTYIVTRFVGKYQRGQTLGNNIEVVEGTRISPGSFVEILRIGNKYIAVAVSKDTVSYLCDLQEDELNIRTGDEKGNIKSASSFKDYLDLFKDKKNNGKNSVGRDE